MNDIIDEFQMKTGGTMVVAPLREKWLKAMSGMTEKQARRLVRRVIKQMPEHHLDPVVYLTEALEKATGKKL